MKQTHKKLSTHKTRSVAEKTRLDDRAGLVVGAGITTVYVVIDPLQKRELKEARFPTKKIPGITSVAFPGIVVRQRFRTKDVPALTTLVW